MKDYFHQTNFREIFQTINKDSTQYNLHAISNSAIKFPQINVGYSFSTGHFLS